MSIMSIEAILSAALGVIFLMSALPKLRHPKGFVLAVLEYRVLPPCLSWFYACLVPLLECLLALLLLTGTVVRSAAITISVLLFSFIVAVGINLARGRDLDCRCFGRAIRRPIGWHLLLQDVVLLGAAAIIALVTQEWVGTESWSVFRLSGLVHAGSLGPLLGCAALAACIAALLSRSAPGRRRSRSEEVNR
jgi:putative oxidoreductase